MKIGKNIKAFRIEKNMDQKEFAKKLHISNKTVSSWECGRTEPNIGMLEKIAEVLGITKSELVEEKPKRKLDYIVETKNGKAVLNGTIIDVVPHMSKEEENIIRLYRAGEYKKLVSLMMDKATEGK